MVSKYAPLVRLKHEDLEEAKRALLQSNLKIQKLQDTIHSTKEAIDGFAKPSGGSLAEYKQYALMADTYRKELQRHKDSLAIAFHRHNAIQDHLNKAMVEFEKFQYLQAQEEQAYRKKLAKKEADYLDEVAVIGYNLQQTGE